MPLRPLPEPPRHDMPGDTLGERDGRVGVPQPVERDPDHVQLVHDPVDPHLQLPGLYLRYPRGELTACL